MDIRLYRFSKRVNTTRHPDLSSSDGYSLHDGQLKENTSIMKPVIRFRINDAAVQFGGSDKLGPPIRYNYAWINNFKRFYWIRDWVWEGPYWVAYMEEDVLASWRGSIGNSTQYIDRCSDSTHGEIIDTYYPANANITTTTNSANNVFSMSFSTNSKQYLLTTIGSGFGINRTAAVYCLNATELQMIVNDLLATNTELETASDNIYNLSTAIFDGAGLTPELWKTLYNPIQYINNLMWLPFTPTHTGSFGLGVGWWEIKDPDSPTITYSASMMNSTYEDMPDITLNIPKHPLANSRGSYCNTSGYSSYQLIYLPFGSFDLPTEYLWGNSTITIKTRVDLIDGTAFMRVICGGNMILSANAQIGIKLNVSQITQDLFSSWANAQSVQLQTGAASASATILSNLTTNPLQAINNIGNGLDSILDMASQRYTGIADACTSVFPTANSTGSAKGSANVYSDVKLVGRFRDIVDKDWNDSGRPYCQKDLIKNHIASGNYSGYVKCNDADCSAFSKTINVSEEQGTTATIHPTSDELVQITKFLNSGIFYI